MLGVGSPAALARRTLCAVSRFGWMSDPEYLAQVGHFFAALAIVFGVGAFGGHVALWIALGVGLVVAAIKEFVFDVAAWGEGDSWQDSAIDFAFYALGGLSGAMLFFVGVARHVAFR